MEGMEAVERKSVGCPEADVVELWKVELKERREENPDVACPVHGV